MLFTGYLKVAIKLFFTKEFCDESVFQWEAGIPFPAHMSVDNNEAVGRRGPEVGGLGVEGDLN